MSLCEKDLSSYKNAWIVVIALFILSCSTNNQAGKSGKPPEGVGPKAAVDAAVSPATGSFSMEIFPKTAARDSTVSLILAGFAAQDAKIDWLLNGAPVESSVPNQITLSQAKKGDSLQARASVRGREILSNKIDIVNAPPEIKTITFLTGMSKPGDALGVAAVGSDGDGDPVTFLFEWTINGSPAGTQERIGNPVKRGDAVAVKVTPYDGESYGTPMTLKRDIQNLPPLIQQHGDFQFDGTRYTYQVKAADPDGDILTYALENPSNGMTINPATGLLTWVVPDEFKGRQDIMVIVSDGQGGSAKYSITATIQQ